VNVLGSLFYGVILGIFLVAFYFKRINGTAVFIAAVIVECFVVVLFFNEQISFMNWLPDISFLWMNVIGAIGVVLVAAIAEMIFPQKLKAVNALQPSLSSLED
jgi:solute:Na+ symporter, SSS family